jgi:hypothetical protein
MKYFEFFKMLEKKDHLIRKTNLTDDQKQIVIDFFTKHPNYEKELGTKWNNPEKITWEDFETVINKERSSKSQIKKAVKAGISGLKEGEDYIHIYSGTSKGSPYEIYQPLTWKGSRVLASNQVLPDLSDLDVNYGWFGDDENIRQNLSGAKWCISYQKTNQYWKRYTLGVGGDFNGDANSVFLFVFGETIPTKKLAIQIRDNQVRKDVIIWNALDKQYGPIGFNFRTYTCEKEFSEYFEDKELASKIESFIPLAVSNKQKTLDNTLKEMELLDQQAISFLLQKCNYAETGVLDIYEEDIEYTDSPEAVERYFIKDGKFRYKFGTIEGDFSCYDCGLTSLEGAPRVVKGYFDVEKNNLTSLKGCPEYVERSFSVDRNPLKALDEMPKRVGGFSASSCGLESLGCLGECNIEGFLNIMSNPLKSLKGISPSFRSGLSCSYTDIENLEGCPEHLWRLDADGCKKLTSLKGKPKTINTHLDITGCDSLEDFYPKYTTIVREIYMGESAKDFLEPPEKAQEFLAAFECENFY